MESVVMAYLMHGIGYREWRDAGRRKSSGVFVLFEFEGFGGIGHGISGLIRGEDPRDLYMLGLGLE